MTLTKVVCAHCGQWYNSTDPQITCYCSPECEAAARADGSYIEPDCIVSHPYDLDTVSKYRCPACGETYYADKDNACACPYCGTAQDADARVCEWCGKRFAEGRFARFCSYRCWAAVRRRGGRTDGVLVCKECGREFVNKGRKVAFCSDACRYNHHIKDMRRWYAEKSVEVARG